MAFIKHELRRVVSNQMEFGQRFELLENKIDGCLSLQSSTMTESCTSLNELDDCPLPIDDLTSLNILENKIAGDQTFRKKFVRIIYYNIYLNYYR